MSYYVRLKITQCSFHSIKIERAQNRFNQFNCCICKLHSCSNGNKSKKGWICIQKSMLITLEMGTLNAISIIFILHLHAKNSVIHYWLPNLITKCQEFIAGGTKCTPKIYQHISCGCMFWICCEVKNAFVYGTKWLLVVCVLCCCCASHMNRCAIAITLS